MINIPFKHISSIMLLLIGTMTAPAYAWQEVDTMNMCNQAVQVVRAYKGSTKGWVNRDRYTNSKKMQIYARNCPQVKAPKRVYIQKKVYQKVKRTKRNTRLARTCRACYKKGYQDGHRAAYKKTKRHYRKKSLRNKKRRIHRSNYRTHAEEILDCKRVDWANRANHSKVIARW